LLFSSPRNCRNVSPPGFWLSVSDNVVVQDRVEQRRA
jgi:hypothetical protein